MGGQRYESVEKTKVKCEALPGIECEGDREFQRDGVPCIKYIVFFKYCFCKNYHWKNT